MSADLSKDPLVKKKLIYNAAREGKANDIRSLLQGLDLPQATDTLHHCTTSIFAIKRPYTYTPLSIAAYHGHKEVVQMLVEDYGMDVDQTDGGHCLVTALGAAVRNNQPDVVRYLVGRGCDVNLINPNGETALSIACFSGNLEVAKYLQQNGASLDISNKEGVTCLMQACCLADEEMVQWLLSLGADVNIKTIHDNTALHFAAFNNLASESRLLLEHGAEMVKNKAGFTPVVLAAVLRSYRVMDCFAESPRVSKEDKIQGLELLGAMTLDMDRAYSYLYRAMRERYSDPNQVVQKAAFPLPTLNQLQESRSLDELENRKSDNDLFCLECWATMQRVLGLSNPSTWHIYCVYVVQQKNVSKFAIHLLLQYAETSNDSPVQICSDYIHIFLHILMEAFSEDTAQSSKDFQEILGFIIKKLLENEDNRKALARNVSSLGLRCLRCLQPFLSQDPGPEEGTPQMKLAKNLVRLWSLLLQNQSVLHDAVKMLQTECKMLDGDRLYLVDLVRFLLQCGVDPNCNDESGKTPLHWVAEFSATEESQRCLELYVNFADALLQAGALPAVPNSKGETSLDLAASSPVKDVILNFHPSLQSLAAVADLEHSINFQSELASIEEAFMQLH